MSPALICFIFSTSLRKALEAALETNALMSSQSGPCLSSNTSQQALQTLPAGDRCPEFLSKNVADQSS